MLTFELIGKVDASIPLDDGRMILLVEAPDPKTTHVRQPTCVCRDWRQQPTLNPDLYGKPFRAQYERRKKFGDKLRGRGFPKSGG